MERAITEPAASYKKWDGYVILFFIISLMGWVLETACFWIFEGEFYDRGYLSLPLCTMYGFAAILIYLLLGTPLSGRWKRLARRMTGEGRRGFLAPLAVLGCLLLYFLAAAALATIVEFATGVLFRRFFGIVLWDYSNLKYQFMGQVSLFYSLAWGALVTAFMGGVFPFLARGVFRLPHGIASVLAVVLMFLVISDFAFNCLYQFSTGWHFFFFRE